MVYGYVHMEHPDEAQIALWCKDIAAFCKRSRYRLASIFIDRGVPDTAIARAGFTRLLEALRQPHAYAVAVPALDHFSRQEFVRDALHRMIILTGRSVMVVYHDANDSNSKPGDSASIEGQP
jgi:DNA invertase Pin-like site-specific DNA recombinase